MMFAFDSPTLVLRSARPRAGLDGGIIQDWNHLTSSKTTDGGPFQKFLGHYCQLYHIPCLVWEESLRSFFGILPTLEDQVVNSTPASFFLFLSYTKKSTRIFF